MMYYTLFLNRYLNISRLIEERRDIVIYIYILLITIRGSLLFTTLRIVDRVLHRDYKSACIAYSLLESNEE
jgi:hypothetical protein